jgi:tRNA pseudouridine38/39 synthase
MSDQERRDDDEQQFAAECHEEGGGAREPPKAKKAFNFANFPSCHAVFKVAYHGQDHAGLAKHATTTNTIETIFCEALKRVRLIPDEGPAKFSRCGRTDKGVSALGNAFSLIVRSSGDNDNNPLDYAKMINNVLPPTVRVVGWCCVPDSFDARFSCTSRCYRYYFDNRSLNLDAMQKACGYLLGEHNFRNFCKLDVTNVSNFVRKVQVAEIITPTGGGSGLGSVSYLTIQANGFLYHQIRCTMTVLFLVGRGLEAPEVVQTLLALGDAKPCYPLADELPLVLWSCEFDPAVVQWRLADSARASLAGQLQDIASALLIRSVVAEQMRVQVDAWYTPSPATAHAGDASAATASGCAVATQPLPACRPTGCDWTRLGGATGRSATGAPPIAPSGVYVKLLERPVEMTYEDRVAHLSASKRARF